MPRHAKPFLNEAEFQLLLREIEAKLDGLSVAQIQHLLHSLGQVTMREAVFDAGAEAARIKRAAKVLDDASWPDQVFAGEEEPPAGEPGPKH